MFNLSPSLQGPPFLSALWMTKHNGESSIQHRVSTSAARLLVSANWLRSDEVNTALWPNKSSNKNSSRVRETNSPKASRRECREIKSSWDVSQEDSYRWSKVFFCRELYFSLFQRDQLFWKR